MNFDFFLFVHWSRLYAGILCFYLSRPNKQFPCGTKGFLPLPFQRMPYDPTWFGKDVFAWIYIRGTDFTLIFLADCSRGILSYSGFLPSK